MAEVSRILRNIYFPKIPPILKLKVGFFSVYIFFCIFFRNWGKFILPKLQFCKFEKKSENIFGSFIIHHSFIHSYQMVGRSRQGRELSAQESRGQAFLTFSSFSFFFFSLSFFSFFFICIIFLFPFLFLFLFLFLFFSVSFFFFFFLPRPEEAWVHTKVGVRPF